ncbi:MAG: NAD-dependent epimerase/dehydratase family protein [Proteobacteria bacterium]|nr:NAD-dependent epimerase/dehydratase family protein [Pseudomonadota bacterium]
MTVLVTGATGFVGSAVARALLREGEAVRVLARPNSDRRNLSSLDVAVVEGDLNEPASLALAVSGCSAVFHVAADYRLWTRHPDDMVRTNVQGSKAIIEAALAAGVERVIYTSSVATLGINSDGVPGDEETPVALGNMIGIYKRSKFLAEEAVQKLIREHGAPVVIVNPSTPVGPLDIKPTPTGRMIAEAASGRIPAFVDTGLNVVHVDDVAAGHLLAWRKGVVGERYVLGGENLPLSEILAEIAQICGRKPPTIRIPHAAIMPIAHLAELWTRISGGSEPFVTVDGVKMARKKMYFSSHKATRELGYRARPAHEAFVDAVAWFRENLYLS